MMPLSPATPDADATDLEMQAGESASPLGPAATVGNNESGDEGPRKRSASPNANQAAWDNPAKKICTEGINLWVQSTSEAMTAVVPDVTQTYQDNHDMLVSMGFNTEEIDSALRMSNNDVEKAVHFLTREIVGLDTSSNKPAPPSSAEKPKGQVNTHNLGFPDLIRNQFIDSDEEEVTEDLKYVWDEESMMRVRLILENNHRYVIYHPNGTLHRRMIVATNIIRDKKQEKMPDVLNFVDEFLSFIIGRHVNCSDVRPGFELLRQLLELQPPYIGEPEAQAIEQFYIACTPLLCHRLIQSPSSVKTVLAIDEMFNFRNKFFIQGVQFIDTPEREYPPLKYMDINRLERLEHKRIYCYLADQFVEQFLPMINRKIDVNNDEEFFEVTLLDLQCLLRCLNIFSNNIVRTNDVFQTNLETWICKALDRFRIVTDKEIRDALIRRQGLDLLQEVVVLCDRFGLDVPLMTQAARLDYLRKWIKCPQMESILHALEELGTIADRFHRSGGMTITRPKSHVNEDYFKQWLEENKVLQIVLTGNMDHVVYVERIQPILQYMTPELTFDDIKFVWSLRKGRMGVSVDNFNKIMEFISRCVNNEQIEWLIELFKKSFRSRETRLYESIFNFCSTIAVQKDRDDECKLKISNLIWELIHIARGPPRCLAFKSLEYGMKKHCDLLNLMFERIERDAFLENMMDSLNRDETFNEITVIYLYIMLDKMKRMFTPKRAFVGEDTVTRVSELRTLLREKSLSDPILDRLERVRQIAHEKYDAMQQVNTDSQSNAVFESTSDTFAGHPTDNILTTSIYGCTDYAFVLTNSLRLLKWLHDMDASIVDVDYVDRLFSIFIERPDATSQEKTEIFCFLNEIKISMMRQDTSRAIITHLCGMDMCTLQISGLRCFCKYWEELPILSNEDSRPVESFIVKKDNECKLFIWKLILFNQYDDVVEKCMETFCERVLVDSPYAVRHHTYNFLSVFSFYVEKLKSELYKRNHKQETPITYDQTELAMTAEEIEQHDVPLDDMLTETISRALNRLVRFMTRFIELGNEKNHMIRENPSHGSSISGHPVTFNVELKNDDDDMDYFQCGMNNWKTFVCDSSTTVGEFKVRLAKRVAFHEGMTEFVVQRRDEDMTMSEANLRYDFQTLQQVKLASETDSIFLSEKPRLLVKPKKSPSRRTELQNQAFQQKKAMREDFLPMSIVSKCNFYDLLHELASNGDKHIRASVRKLLLLLPTQPSLLKRLKDADDCDEEVVLLTDKITSVCAEYIDPTEPGRMLYALEAISSIVAPSRLTHQSCEDSMQLTSAILEVDVINNLTTNILNQPHVVPLHKCSQADRHSIFERILQIIRSVTTGRSTFLKMIKNEFKVREEMQKTCERMMSSRQTPRPIDGNMDYALVKQQIMPPPCVETMNNPSESVAQDMCTFAATYKDLVVGRSKAWSLGDLIPFLEKIRNFQWIHVATESVVSKPIKACLETEEKADPESPTASEKIRSVMKGERWGDECRLIIVKKAFSLIRHMVQEWVHAHRDGSKPLLEILFTEKNWIDFYQDVLVNTQQEAYRKYMQENIVKMGGRDYFEVLTYSLKMLMRMFTSLPLRFKLTSDLSELERRQRQNCDGIVQTIVEIFYYDKSHCHNPREETPEINWEQVGVRPSVIVRDQIRSLLDFKPRFSTTNAELCHTENVYAAAKMRMINCLLVYCSQAEIEEFSPPFLNAIINDFLFPVLPDIENSMFEEDVYRWDYLTRDTAITTVNTFCERSYKNMYQLLLMWSKFPIANRQYDPSYRPIVRSRQCDKVGLKNDGGTCYMNATIQQLVHVPGLARELISIQNIDPTLKWGDNTSALLCELQRVFAQLNFSRCQATVPIGLWREFRFEPDVPLNTKQHHDAIDFYSILLDKCANVLKKLDLPPLFQNRFFGKYSYEKICYGCWHRYKSPDEEFNCISLALSGDNLEEALESFLAAHVMEGENAYHCEKCNEKKTTLNRTSFLELPSTMTIQLKRFTYDLVNNMIRKDNKYFRFPFEIDMTPYMTASRHVPDDQVQDLFDEMLWGNDDPATPPHKNGSFEKSNMGTGSASNPSLESPQKKLFRRHRSSNMRLSQSFVNASGLDTPTQKPLIYELVGVLAHSGIATAGHYYSFIKERREEYKDSGSYGKWHHINDQVVSQMPLTNVDDVWYGGTFTQEAGFMGLDERIRHYNAYVLFYEKKREESDILLPPHVLDRLYDPKPKVTFDVTDEQTEDKKQDRVKEAQELHKKTITEARTLRLKMFHSLDDNLKKFLNDENCKFQDDRDFFSYDLYLIYIHSLLPLLRRDDTVEYTVTQIEQPEFYRLAFEHIALYIIRVAWTMFDDHRPKNFPRAATDLIKLLLVRHRDNKTFFFRALEANNSEMLNRLLESTEYDIRNSFWMCIKLALRQWILENGRHDENLMDASPDSTDLDEDDDEDDEEDDEDDLEDEDSEAEEMMRQEMRPTPMAIVTQLIAHQHRAANAQLKPLVPVDLSKARNSRINIVRKIIHTLPFRVHRMENNGRHYSRQPVEILYMLARLNDFGKSVLHVAGAISFIADFLFEDNSTVFCRLRFTEDRLKGLGLWPSLPGLYFELILDSISRAHHQGIDREMHFRTSILSPSGRYVSEVIVMYCISRDECEAAESRYVNDEKAMHNRIISCYIAQIDLLRKSEIPDSAKDYIFNWTQVVLKDNFFQDNFSDLAFVTIQMDQWPMMIEFFLEMAHRLVRAGMTSLALTLLRNILWVGGADDDEATHPGLLPLMVRWKEHDALKFRRMSEAMFSIRRAGLPEFVPFFSKCHRVFRGVFQTLGPQLEENDNTIEPMDHGEEEDMEQEEIIIGPQLLRRAENSVDLTKATSDAVATARVTETKEIDLSEHLKTADELLVQQIIQLSSEENMSKQSTKRHGSPSKDVPVE